MFFSFFWQCSADYLEYYIVKEQYFPREAEKNGERERETNKREPTSDGYEPTCVER